MTEGKNFSGWRVSSCKHTHTQTDIHKRTDMHRDIHRHTDTQIHTET